MALQYHLKLQDSAASSGVLPTVGSKTGWLIRNAAGGVLTQNYSVNDGPGLEYTKSIQATSGYIDYSVSGINANTSSFCSWSRFPLRTASSFKTLWRFSNTAPGFQHILAKNDSTNEIGLYSGSFTGFGYNLNQLTGWHHIAVVRTTSGCRLYVNGTGAGNVISMSPRATIFTINGDPDTSSQQWGIPACDFRIYNHSLTANEIMGIMSESVGADRFKIQHYTLNDNSITGTNSVGINLIRNASTINVVGGPGGLQPTACRFDGTHNITGSTTIWSNSTGLFMGAWVRPTSYTGNMGVIASVGTYNMRLNTTSGLDFWYGGITIGSNRITTLNGTVPKDKWTHVAVNWDGQTATLYINGTPSISGFLTGVIYSSSSATTVGSWGASDRFIGDITDARIYRIPLTESQISEIYNIGSGDLQTLSTTVNVQRLGGITVRGGRRAQTRNSVENQFTTGIMRRYINRFDNVLYYQYTG